MTASVHAITEARRRSVGQPLPPAELERLAVELYGPRPALPQPFGAPSLGCATSRGDGRSRASVSSVPAPSTNHQPPTGDQP